MLEIKLEIVSNGIVKTINDTNYNGAGEIREIKNVYETEDDKQRSYKNTIHFFYELSDDLGIDMGNKFDEKTLEFSTGWGSHYQPNLLELKLCIKNLSSELKGLKSLEKAMKQDILNQTLLEDSKK